MTDSLDSIKAAFAKAKNLTPEDTARDETPWAEVRKAFNYSSEVINLSTVVRGVAPRIVSDAVIDTYTRVNEYRPGGNYSDIVERRRAIRNRLAERVGCEAEELAITRNTTDGVTTVIAGLKLAPGDEIVTTTGEHNAYYGALYQRAARDSLEIRRVHLPQSMTC